MSTPGEGRRKIVGSCRVYLITPPAVDLAPFTDALARALDAGDVACVQLRLKDVSDDEIRRAVDRLMPVAHAHDVAFVLNDRPDLAAATGCDGVHVGQEDASYASARAAVGPDAIVGVTCHASPHLAMEAGEQGADYVAFGAFFPTDTKIAKGQASVDILHWWSTIMTVPCVAIGGINAANCGPLVEAGADFLAVIAAVWSHPDGPAAGVRAMNAAIAAARRPG
ncbi:MAG TPA: thiamine phosphate synthase [Candidatus Sulfotelmatobacter sp.]|nr:thiamine phosphate synthase [Candidatus Sulfotelmatobacter sp.]